MDTLFIINTPCKRYYCEVPDRFEKSLSKLLKQIDKMRDARGLISKQLMIQEKK